MIGVLGDLRFGGRMLWKRRGTSVLAALALSLGIGLTTIMFSIVQGVLLRGLPFEDADRLLAVVRTFESSTGRAPIRMADFTDFRASQRSFEDLAGFRTSQVTVSKDGLAERVASAGMTPNTFPLLRVVPTLGRPLSEADAAAGAAPAALVSHRFWMTHLGGTPDVINQVLRVEGTATTIVGVMPEGFAFPNTPALWTPLTIDPGAPRTDRHAVDVLGRLVPSATVREAQTEFTVIARRLAAAHPENTGIGVATLPYIEWRLGGDVRRTLFAMLGAVCGVMLIACANVASLQIARSLERSREIAVRTALGARRSRIVRQLLTEGLSLSAVGAAAGLLIAWVGVRLFNNAVVDTDPPFWIDIRIDTTVLAFVTVLVVFATLAAGLLPAFRATRLDFNAVLKDEGRANSGVHMGRLGRGLVIVEVLLSCCLLIVSGLMIKSIVTIGRTTYPYETEHIVTAEIVADVNRYRTDEDRIRLASTLSDALARVPGLRQVALATGTPQGGGTSQVAIEGAAYAAESDYPYVRRIAAAPSLFETLGIAIRRGRAFTEADDARSIPVAVVTEDFAGRFFPGSDPVGRRFRIGRDTEDPWITIVGLVPPLVVPGRDGRQVTESVYVPLAQAPVANFTLLGAAPDDPLAAVPAIRQALRDVDRDLPLSQPRTLAEAYWQNTWAFRVFGTLFLSFGVAALLLASAGLYGVMAFTVSRRTSEIGVRMALGAPPGQVRRMFLVQGMTRVAIGIVLGLIPAWLLGRQMTELLYRTTPLDPLVISTTIGVLLLSGLAACVVPARRAAAIDPASCLRQQ